MKVYKTGLCLTKNMKLLLKVKKSNVCPRRVTVVHQLYKIVQVFYDLPALAQHINAKDMKNLSVIEFISCFCTPNFLSAVCCKSIELPNRTSSRPCVVVFIDNPKGHKSLVNRHRNITIVHWWRDIDLNRMINDHPRLLRLRITHLKILRIL